MTRLYSTFLLAFTSFLLINTAPVHGQATTPKVQKIPFHGKLTSVDTSAQTITLVGKTSTRVFHVTPETKITDGAGAASTLSAAVVGEDVGGSYSKDSAGTLTLFSLRLGAKDGSKPTQATATAAAAANATAASAATPAPVASPAVKTVPALPPAASAAAAPAATEAAAKVKKQTCSGKVVSVDSAANTLVIHGKADQTFTVTPATKITGAADLAAIAAGTKVSGTYIKSVDGATLTLATLKVSK